MHGLKKTGVTLVTGALVGAYASVALGGELVAVGDYGSYFAGNPDGQSDRVLLNTATNGITIEYVANNGLNISDTSGQLVDVLVNAAGEGYGQNASITAALLRDSSPFSADTRVSGWYTPATINNNGTGGIGAAASYTIDGPAGGYYYFGEYTVFGGTNNYGDLNDLNNIQITYGGTGYWPGATNGSIFSGAANFNTENALRIVVSDAGTDSRGTCNFLGAGRNASTGNTLAGIAVGNGSLSAAMLTGGRNSTAFITNDNSTGRKSRTSYGNYRKWLGHTPPGSNGQNVSWAADTAGDVANLDIVANSTTARAAADGGNATSGIGYSAGEFDIYDANGDRVTGVDIEYDIDGEGRVYIRARGTYFGGTSGRTGGPNPASIAANVNVSNSQGWEITRNNANLTTTVGYTFMPQGNGFGFDGRGIQLYGQIVGLPTIGTNGSFNTVGLPELTLTALGSASAPAANASTDWRVSYSSIPAGALTGGTATATGQSYTSAPNSFINTNGSDSGTGGTLRGVLGAVGVRDVADADGAALEVDLFGAGYACYPNGDFNGDGNSDMLWRSAEFGITAIWNMGDDARVSSSGFLTDPGVDWSLVGIGSFGYDGVGCCLFWHNSLSGATAVWVVNSSSANSEDWLVGGAFSDTIGDLNWVPACTNNPVQNVGSSVYWREGQFGECAVWPLAVASNANSVSNSGAAFVTDDAGDNVAVPSDAGFYIAGVGNMDGRPTALGNGIYRDIVLSSGLTGETAIWIMDSNGSSISPSASFTTSGGVNTQQFYTLAGIGQYDTAGVAYSVTNAGIPGGGFRTASFGNLYWVASGLNSAFSWKMDRNIDLIDFTATPVTGTGTLSDPFAITGTSTAN